jgi:hypothetical protein
MMVPKRSLLCASAALLVLSTAAEAQMKAHKYRRVTQPLIRADLDLSTGVYTIGGKVKEKGPPVFNTALSLTNLDFSGGVAIDSLQCEWFDSFQKGRNKTGGKSQIMTSFLFAYCSSAKATNSGGVGGSATISFDEGYQVSPAPGTPRPTFASRTQVYNLSGLPASTNSSSFFGNFSCIFIRVFTATPGANPQTAPGSWTGGDAMPDSFLNPPGTRNMGYAWDFRDASPFQGLAHTFPFLACVQSCSGVGPDGQTFVDGIDQYCGLPGNFPPYTMITTFTFGTAPTNTSMSLEIREAEPISSGSTIFDPGGNGNPAIAGLGPDLGAPWSISFDCSAATAPKPLLIGLRFAGPTFVNFGAFGFSYIGTVPHAKFFIPNHAQGIKTLGPFPLPLDLAYLNACYVAQGFCGSTPKGFLTEALIQTIGSN